MLMLAKKLQLNKISNFKAQEQDVLIFNVSMLINWLY